MKISIPPKAARSVTSSSIRRAAKITVIIGSAKRNELVAAAVDRFMTWNQMKYPSNEHVVAK